MKLHLPHMVAEQIVVDVVHQNMTAALHRGIQQWEFLDSFAPNCDCYCMHLAGYSGEILKTLGEVGLLSSD